MSERCPFCGMDPYHYVDNGCGMEAVAVVCCELGIEMHTENCRPAVTQAADRLYRLLSARDLLNSLIEEEQDKAADLEESEPPPPLREGVPHE